MRILAIRGKNLASLRGDFAIELNQPPLEQAGLFAITGHTGAGKSTLLDALCLALFDKIPRLIDSANVKVGRPDEDEKARTSSNDVRSILSRGATNGYAQVDFVGLNKRSYQAHWEIKRARNKVAGRLQKQTMILRDLNTGEIIGQNKSDTLEAISARIGLSFEQFRRSVLLAQGDFAAFLKARSDERSGLLERITGTEIYSQLSIAAYRQFQQQEQYLNRIRDKLSVEMPLGNEQRQNLLIDIKELEDEQNNQQKTIDKNKALLDWHATNKLLEDETSAIELTLKGLKGEQKHREYQKNELEKIISVQALRSLDSVVDEIAVKSKRLEEQSQQAKIDHDKAKTAELKLNDGVLKTQQKLHESEKHFYSIKPEITRAREFDTKVKLTHKECIEQEKQLNALTAKLQQLSSKKINIDDINSERESIEQTLRQLNEALNERFSAREKISLEKLNDEKDHTEQRLKHRQKGFDIYQSFIMNQNDLNTRISDIESLKKKISAQSQNLRDQEKLLADTNIVIEEARRALLMMQESVTQGAQSLRSLLQDQQPCPVCGALEHPWADQDSKLNQQYQQQQARVEELENSRQSCLLEINKQQQIIKYETDQVEKSAEQTDSLKSALLSLQQQWQEVITDIDSLDNLTDQGNHDYFLSEIKALDDTLEELKAQEKQAIAIQKDIDNLHIKKQNWQIQEKDFQKVLSEQQVLLNTIDNLSSQLSNSQSEYDKRMQLEKSLQSERQQLLGGQDADEVETRHVNDIKSLSKQYDVEKQAQEKARQQQISSAQQCRYLQQQRDDIDAEKKKHETRLQEELQNRTLTRSQLKKLLEKNAAWIKNKQQELNAFNQQIIKAETLLSERSLKLQQHQQTLQNFDQQLRQLPPDIIQEQWQAQKNALQILRNSQQEKIVELKQDDARKRRMLKFQDELEIQQEQWRQWGAINELIGSANGNKFRVFAQSLTLESLLAHANSHLNDFARRYQLQRVPGSDLDLQIVDRDMADEVRSVQSLSGGESFLVSLALALGLASLSSTRTQVESLFIDEGFGTLDQETLDIAIASLDTLQGMGRKVGIISHVPILVERIGTRVVVKKLGGGRSKVITEN